MSKEYKVLQKRNRAVRIVVLAAILVVSTALGLMHQYGVPFTPAGVDALCPFGGIESFLSLISGGGYLKRIAFSSFVLLAATVLVALVFKRSFCGNYCPLGFLQEIFGNIGRKIFKKRFVVPRKIDRFLRYIKYFLLIMITVHTWIAGELVVRERDPWAAYHHLLSDELFTEFLIGFIILLVALIGSALVDRFFCKYMCPMGAFLASVSRLGMFGIVRDEEKCISCGLCNLKCPVNVDVMNRENVSTRECINCNLCVNVCPVENALAIDFKGKKISPLAVTILTLVLMLMPIAVTTATGQFEWKVKTLKDVAAESKLFNADDIKGRHTFKELSETTGVPKEKFVAKFGLTDEQFEAPIKDLTHAEGSNVDTEDVRLLVKEELGKE